MYLFERILLQRQDTRNLGVSSHRDFGRLERAVIPSNAGEPVFRTDPFLLRVARFKHTGIFYLVLDLSIFAYIWFVIVDFKLVCHIKKIANSPSGPTY